MKMLTPNQVLFENVTAQYPRINQTYRFDNMENKTVPCKPEEDGAAYEVSFLMSNEDATEFLKKCDEIYEETAAADTKRKWKPKPMYYPYKELDDGQPQGKAKLKGAYNGEATKPPLQKDANRNSLPPDFRLTSGSKVNVWGQLFAYNTGAVSGVGLRLRGVQVLELQEEASSDPFSATDGFTAAKQEDDPFGLPPVKPSTSVGSFIEDEVPFLYEWRI
jgi:hypothetical protein